MPKLLDAAKNFFSTVRSALISTPRFQNLSPPQPPPAVFKAPQNLQTAVEPRLMRGDLSGASSNYRQTELNKKINTNLENQTNKSMFAFTRHPTMVTKPLYKTPDGKPRRPFLWEEIKDFYRGIPKLVQSLGEADAFNKIKAFQTWVGYDMDRHQDERANIFTFTMLQNMRGCMIANGVLENSNLIIKIDVISDNLEKSFNENQTINVAQDLAELKNLIDQEKPQQKYPLIPILGLDGQYRISSEDLKTGKGVEKIKERIHELATLKHIFGKSPVSEVIIADCTKLQEMKQLGELLAAGGLEQVTFVPLIEEMLEATVLHEIISNAANKVMLAGSDSIQRETYFGALLLKIEIQRRIHEINQVRRCNGQEEITFEEGAGSTPNRNGCLPKSRMGTILENMPYELTKQGQEGEKFITDSEFLKFSIDAITDSPRCTMEELNVAEPIIKKIFDTLSVKQIELQKEPGYTSNFNTDKIVTFANNNAHYGSRAKSINGRKFPETGIKAERAITQSMLNRQTGYHPEIMFWNEPSMGDIKKDIIKNIHNPLIQDLVNQLTATWQICCPKQAAQWITNPKFLKDFELAYDKVGKYLKEIQKIPNLPDNLILKDLENLGPAFNLQRRVDKTELEQLWKVEKGNPLALHPGARSLLERTGSGISTTKEDTNEFVTNHLRV